ncbi:MAG: hypothetical protein R6W81_02085 [Bacteroidales bacterium]
MTAQDQIIFLAELSHLIDELQELIRDYCRLLTAGQDGCMVEDEPQYRNIPF